MQLIILLAQLAKAADIDPNGATGLIQIRQFLQVKTLLPIILKPDLQILIALA